VFALIKSLAAFSKTYLVRKLSLYADQHRVETEVELADLARLYIAGETGSARTAATRAHILLFFHVT
jgi:hypothetical protein